MFRPLTILSVLLVILCGLTAAMWIRGRSTGDDLFLRGGGGVLWRINCGDGNIVLSHFTGWPSPPRFHYRHYAFDPGEALTPVFVLAGHGLSQVETRCARIVLSRGTLCVATRDGGAVDWDSPAIPVLQSIRTVRVTSPIPYWELTVPWVYILAALATVPIIRLASAAALRWRRHQRVRLGFCPCCGYDVRANREKCPECGERTGCA